MKLVFDERALVDLEGIYNWIAEDNPAAAKAVVERVFASTEHLATFPQMGHAGRDEWSFEWVVPRLPRGPARLTLYMVLAFPMSAFMFGHMAAIVSCGIWRDTVRSMKRQRV